MVYIEYHNRSQPGNRDGDEPQRVCTFSKEVAA